MRTKTILLIALIAFSLPVIGQERNSNFDFRLGTGVSLLGSGDMLAFNYENEVNYKMNKYFTSSASISFGKSNSRAPEIASFVHGNFNIFFSPFKNNRRFDFRVGTGLTYCNISDAHESFRYWINGVLIDVDYEFDRRNSFGCNIIMENSYFLTDRLLMGLKLFTQPCFNGDINSGILLKLGLII